MPVKIDIPQQKEHDRYEQDIAENHIFPIEQLCQRTDNGSSTQGWLLRVQKYAGNSGHLAVANILGGFAGEAGTARLS